MIPYDERLAQATAYSNAGIARAKAADNPKGQKFPKGSRVHIAADLGTSMSHFESDMDATVMYTYKQAFGGGKREAKEYCLDIDGYGEVSWYYEHQLTLLKT